MAQWSLTSLGDIVLPLLSQGLWDPILHPVVCISQEETCIFQGEFVTPLARVLLLPSIALRPLGNVSVLPAA